MVGRGAMGWGVVSGCGGEGCDGLGRGEWV